jgi:hypothetical protein
MSGMNAINISFAKSNDATVSIGFAEDRDLSELARIAEHNFHSSNNYKNLHRDVKSRFAKRNSAESLRKKLHSGSHKFVVAREHGNRRAVGFAIFKILNEKCLLGTRMHVAPEFASFNLARKMHQFTLDLMQGEGYELLYGDISGEAQEAMCRTGFLYVDSFANKAIKDARIDRIVMDAHASSRTAIAESVFIRHLSSDSSPYSIFLASYGLLVERLFKKIERMHKTGSSGIRQSVFAHVENGLILIQDLRLNLGKNFLDVIKWEDVETMWIFHDIGEIGLDSDIPSYKKSKLDSLQEEEKTCKILGSINHRGLRMKLVELHARYEQRKLQRSSSCPAGVDKEAAICAFVDKLEASIFIGTSGIGEVWKKKVGRWLFGRILRKHALGAFIAPAKDLCSFLDQGGKEQVHAKLAGVIATYYDRGLISKALFEERMAAIETVLASPNSQFG